MAENHYAIDSDARPNRLRPHRIAEKPQRGPTRYIRRAPKNEQDAWSRRRTRRIQQVETPVRAIRSRLTTPSTRRPRGQKQTRGRPRERPPRGRTSKRVIGSPIKEAKSAKSQDDPSQDTRMSPSQPPPKSPRIVSPKHRGSNEHNPYRNEPTIRNEKQEAPPSGRYPAPTYGDRLRKRSLQSKLTFYDLSKKSIRRH